MFNWLPIYISLAFKYVLSMSCIYSPFDFQNKYRLITRRTKGRVVGEPNNING